MGGGGVLGWGVERADGGCFLLLQLPWSNASTFNTFQCRVYIACFPWVYVGRVVAIVLLELRL